MKTKILELLKSVKNTIIYGEIERMIDFYSDNELEEIEKDFFKNIKVEMMNE